MLMIKQCFQGSLTDKLIGGVEIKEIGTLLDFNNAKR